MTDHRKNQRVIATLALDDKGQDFIEIDVLENGVMLGDSIMFRDGRLSLLGIGTTNGAVYEHVDDFVARKTKTPNHYKGYEEKKSPEVYVYFYETGEKQPLPWEATTLKYRVLREVGVKNPERFLAKAV